MGDVQVAVQRFAAVFPEQVGNMRPVFGGFAAFQKVRQVGVTKGPLADVPDLFPRGGFQIFILLAVKFQPEGVFVQQKIPHPARSFLFYD